MDHLTTHATHITEHTTTPPQGGDASIPVPHITTRTPHIVEGSTQPVPTIGDHILYCMPEGHSAGQDRPAVVVRVWSATMVNLQVLIDGTNDYPHDHTASLAGSIWKTSVHYSASPTPGTWRWPTQKA